MNVSIKSVLYFPITKIILGIGICFSLLVGVQNYVSKPFFYSFIPDKSIADPIIHLISVLVLGFGYYFLFRFYDKRDITELSLKHLPQDMFGGFSFGFLTISLSIFVLYVLGNYQFLSITTSHYSIALFTKLIVAALIEDLFIRGLIVREMENWLGTHVALIIASLVELWHLFNDNSSVFSGIVDLIWGFTMAMFFIYSKRVWLPFFFHLGWNFAQPFYGSNLSGLEDMGNIVQSKFHGSELLTGGAYGIECSIFTVFFLLIIGIILYFLAKKEGKIIQSKRFKCF
jgi:uncharacterized protein